MSSEVKQRKKGAAKETKDVQRSAPGPRTQDEKPGKAVGDSPGSAGRCPELRTLLCLLCVAVCGALTWLVIQQSHNFAVIEQKYQSLQQRSAALDALEDKVQLLFGKLEVTQSAVSRVKDLQILQRTEQLQKEITNMEQWSNNISGKRNQMEENLTSLQEAMTQMEQRTSAITTDVSRKVAAVKTDVRRISGLDTDVATLTESVSELEKKLEKVEKNTIQSIGEVLAGSIDRIIDLKDAVNRNSDRIDLMKKRLSELRSNFSKNSDRLQNLESDRIKVIKAVNFANDLRPKVFTLRKDFAHLEPMLNDLALRIGRLASDLLSREKDITVINEKIYNLSVMKSEILDLSSKTRMEL
ncbi:inhibitor of nuclear factor kappa-B kinase-interacting protein isoform 2-T2 [Discoglossus pictus]